MEAHGVGGAEMERGCSESFRCPWPKRKLTSEPRACQRCTPVERFPQTRTQILALPPKVGLLWGHLFSLTSRVGWDASFRAVDWLGMKMVGCVAGAFFSCSNSVFLCSSWCFITDRNHWGARREKGKGFCINSCLADSIYKVDFIAKVFVLALKCQNSTVISSAQRRVFENMGPSPVTDVCDGEGIPEHFLWTSRFW